MRIRSQLIVLVVAAVAPMVVLTALLTVQLWRVQHAAFDARNLDRVSALAPGARSRDGERATAAGVGYGQPADRQRSFEACFDEHLVKPVDPLVLERTLVTALASMANTATSGANSS